MTFLFADKQNFSETDPQDTHTSQQAKAPLGVPAIKQVRQFYIRTRMSVELSSKNKLLIAFVFMI